MGVVQGDQMVLNIGPQHPSTHGVLRLEVTTDGEIVSKIRSLDPKRAKIMKSQKLNMSRSPGPVQEDKSLLAG